MTRGGKRKGAGRKQAPLKKVKKNITIRPDFLQWINDRSEKVSAVIDKALEKWISTDK